MNARSLVVVASWVVMMWPVLGAAQSATSSPLVADSHMTPAAGALDVLAVQHVLSSVEDRFLPMKFGDEQRRLQLVAGILYRAAKFSMLDIPQDHMLLVVAHEVFGHGARARELGRGTIRYTFDVPIPFGNGGGSTSFSGQFPASPLAILALETSGIEAQNVLADTLAERALGRGQFHYREAWMYFESRFLAFDYIESASAFSREGHDVADFVRTFDEACSPPDCTPTSLREVKRGARLILADPLLYLAVYGLAGGYVGNGRTTSGIPMIPLGGGVRYLPSIGFHMTPFGTERVIRNVFVSGARDKGQGASGGQGASANEAGARVTSVTLRLGRTGASTPWGLDVRSSNVRLPFTRLRVSPAMNFWRQPYILSRETSAPLETGAAVAATAVLPLPRRIRSEWVNGIYVTGGVKSEGFVPGEQLSGGAIFRAGLTLLVN